MKTYMPLASSLIGIWLAVLAAFVFYMNGFVFEPVSWIRWAEFGCAVLFGVFFLVQLVYWLIINVKWNNGR